jgi:hypothetical protein
VEKINRERIAETADRRSGADNSAQAAEEKRYNIKYKNAGFYISKTTI